MKKGKSILLTTLVVAGAFVVLSPHIQYCSGTLNKFKSYFELIRFLEQSKNHHYMHYRESLGEVRLLDMDTYQALDGVDYSQTNIQVEGVDEADIVKTDGTYIYAISSKNVVIVKAYPAEEAAVLSRISFDGSLKQIFINDERLVVFYQNETQTTIANIYNLQNNTSPIFEKQIAIDGTYFASRMIGDFVYVIVRKNAYYYNGTVNLPKICFNNERRIVRATEIYYSDIADYPCAFTTIISFNIHDDNEEPIDKTILSGWSTNIYVSMQNIYLAITNNDQTILHRIQIGNGEISYVADGKVQGRVLNQFSMDEHNGYFRIATTSEMIGSSWLLNLQNNLYVLNMDLETIGMIEEVAPGELIHSARFMGDVCYLVTFRKVDPFFAIDLSNPANPRILGELKITGYSNYLHSYDENHVIGVGKETVSAETGDFSWYQGVKISLFDVTDLTEPKELAKYEIGDRGSDSPVLSDHKAFLFSKERNLLVIPVSVAKADAKAPSWATGEIVWQGAYVFTISLELEEKITLKGTITHVENGNVHNASYHATRALYINDVLYTISESKIKMNSLLDLSEIGELNLKG